jgi:hypothetical protein
LLDRVALPDQPTTPRKRNRRCAAIVIVLASFLCWWNWPRGDERLVGRWSVSDELEPNRALSTLILKPNGNGSWEYDDCTCAFGWRASSGSLDLGSQVPTVFRPTLKAMSLGIYQMTNRYILVEVEDYELLNVTPDEIVILSKSVNGARRQILRRIRN